MQASAARASCWRSCTGEARRSHWSAPISTLATACCASGHMCRLLPGRPSNGSRRCGARCVANQFLRMIENRFVTSEETFVPLEAWDACCTGQPIPADTSLPVWGAVDACTKRDSTAITAFAWDRAAKKARLVFHRIFQPSAKDPIDFETMIEDTLYGLKQRFRLREVRFDPWGMQASAQRLSRNGVKMVEFPQSPGNLTEASQNLYELITGQNLIAYPDPDIRLAISRAVAVEIRKRLEDRQGQAEPQDRRCGRHGHGGARCGAERRGTKGVDQRQNPRRARAPYGPSESTARGTASTAIRRRVEICAHRRGWPRIEF